MLLSRPNSAKKLLLKQGHEVRHSVHPTQQKRSLVCDSLCFVQQALLTGMTQRTDHCCSGGGANSFYLSSIKFSITLIARTGRRMVMAVRNSV